MNIKIWTSFIKRTNSTKQPTGGTDKTVVLKRDCTIDAPSFILNEPVSNITYVQAFGNYYFVHDIIIAVILLFYVFLLNVAVCVCNHNIVDLILNIILSTTYNHIVR